MAHYAVLDNNIVTQVFVGKDEDEGDINWEEYYGAKRTSYNTNGGVNANGTPFRKNYAGLGYTYDEERDAFIPPQPYTSWTLNEDTCLWDSPVPYPSDGVHEWDETNGEWVELLWIN